MVGKGKGPAKGIAGRVVGKGKDYYRLNRFKSRCSIQQSQVSFVPSLLGLGLERMMFDMSNGDMTSKSSSEQTTSRPLASWFSLVSGGDSFFTVFLSFVLCVESLPSFAL